MAGNDEQINPATLELLERRIADRVTDQARTRVIAYYAIVGTTLAALAGLLGWNAVNWIEREAQRAIDAEIKALTQEAEKTSREVAINLKVLETLAQRAGKTLDSVEMTLKNFEPKSRKLEEESHKLEQAIQDIGDLETRVRPVRGTVEITDQNRADIARVSRELADLARQVKELIALAQKTASPNAASAGTPYADLAAATARVASGSESLTRQIAAARETTTVYVQFANMARETIDQLRQILGQEGFTVPAAERTSAADGLFEVRYFHQTDREAAERLAALVSEAAHKSIPGETRTAKVQDLTAYPRTKPKPGTVELWYGRRG
ncbi:MAG: SPOR domain-containing protein [Acetobacteraceae bacterium]